MLDLRRMAVLLTRHPYAVSASGISAKSAGSDTRDIGGLCSKVFGAQGCGSELSIHGLFRKQLIRWAKWLFKNDIMVGFRPNFF
jgi:hypothetical protein